MRCNAIADHTRASRLRGFCAALGLAFLVGLVPNTVQAQTVMGFRIEYPAYSSLTEAGSFSRRLGELLDGWHAVHVDMNPPAFEVMVGDFQDRGQAAIVLRALRAEGIAGGRVVRSRVRVPFGVEQGAAPSAEVPPTRVAVSLRQPSTAAPRPGPAVPSLRPVVARRTAPGHVVEVLPIARPAVGELAAAPGPAAVPVPPHLSAAVSVATPVAPAVAAETVSGRAPEYAGFLGAVTCSETFGWAWNPEAPEERLTVELYDGDRSLGRVTAELARGDLAEAGVGDGRYGFRFSLADLPQTPARIEARVAGSSAPLRGSPRPNPCVAESAPDAPPKSAGPTGPPAAGSSSPPVRNAGRDEPGNGASARPKSVHALAIPGRAIVLDGRLDEAAWTEVEFVTDFEQKGLTGGFSRPAWTRVAFAYDDEALYVGARMEGPGSEDIDTRVARRDEPGNVDRILISLDTYGDRRTAYTFGVTAGGARLDHYHPEDDEIRRDQRFDPVWEARTTVDSTGWTAEMKIPFTQLRFGDGEIQSWGLNVRRWNPQRFMNLYWVVVPMEEQGWASRFGELTGLEGVAPARRVEIAPYVLRGVTSPAGTWAGAAPEGESTLRVGGDLKLGLGPDLTVDAAILPDFGQVDADPADVNLTAFETTFEERRPFFTEGAALFSGRGPRYFYSRRIGAIPHGTDPGNAVDMPVNTDILSAVKLTGRLDSGLSVGALMAVTPTERALLSGGEPDAQAVVAPASTYVVGRAERELGGSGSVVGFTVTGLHRALEAGTAPEAVLGRDAVAGGGDWLMRFGRGAYELSGFAGFSTVRGDEGAIAGMQRSSAHYFQRPDAEHVEYDPTRTSLSGYTGGVTLAKVAGTRWTWSVGGAMESPGFNIRDVGLLRSADHRDAFATLGYRSIRPGALFRYYRLTGVTSASWNFGGVRNHLSSGLVFSGAFLNLWRAYASVTYEAPSLSDELTRGGPLMGTPAAYDVGLGVSSAFGSRSQWSLNGAARRDELGGWFYSANAGATLRAGPHVELSLFPGYSRSLDTRQYYGFLPGGPTGTFGRREIFSDLTRSEVYAQARIDVSLTPDLSVQLYAEPFASSGDYARYGELTDAGATELRRYGDDGSTVEPGDYGSLRVRDGAEEFTLWPTPFNIRSFRSNAVARWEWRPGSSLFLIWQQNRWGYEGQGARVRGGTLLDALRDSGENIFMVKLDYRLGIR